MSIENLILILQGIKLTIKNAIWIQTTKNICIMLKAESAQTNCDIVETAVIRKRVQKVFNAQLNVMLSNMS